MLNEKQINRINRFLKDKTFNYTGNFLQGVKIDVDYKIELLGYREMIHVGTKYPYIRVKVIITDFKDVLSKTIFKVWSTRDPIKLTKHFNENLYVFRMGLTQEISDVLQFFDSENYNHVTIDDFEIDYDFTEVVTEQKKTRQTTRTVVKDIINLIKSDDTGVFYLPEDDYYFFDNFPVEFSVEVEINKSSHIKDFGINANFIPDEEVIEVLIIYNPLTLKQNLYNIVGELNEIITHELEHSLQNYKGDFDDDEFESTEDSLNYYLQPHEITAQVKGFRRISNLRKLPFQTVVRDWFDTHTDIHKLNDDEKEEVIDVLLDYNKQKF
jgi:hypothetical protein